MNGKKKKMKKKKEQDDVPRAARLGLPTTHLEFLNNNKDDDTHGDAVIAYYFRICLNQKRSTTTKTKQNKTKSPLYLMNTRTQ